MARSPSAVAVLRYIDAVCDHFEAAARGGQSPRIEDYAIAGAGARRDEVLIALVRLDAELRGTPIDDRLIQEYAQRFPHDLPAIEGAFRDMNSRPARLKPLPTPAASLPAQVPPKPSSPTASESPQIVLEVTDGPQRGIRFQFNQHETLVAGRASTAQLRLQDDLHFSRYHFRLEVNPPMCYLLDLGSRNGTSVNGRKVKECFLKNGDVISGGRTKIRFAVTDELPATEIVESPGQSAEVGAAPGEVVATPLPSGLSIPGYDLVEELGRGTMGIVYRAVQKSNGQECAVKLLTPAQVGGEKSLQLFLREVSILSQLDHPRIVRFLGLGSTGRSAYFAMEYVSSVPFERIVGNCSLRKKVQIVCGIACQVLEALEYAHGKELVHRDIKPANILLARRENKLSVKLADFGLAKSFTNAGLSEVTRDGDIRGSLAYMAPEQLINSRQARPSCDLYSLGATLYRYLSGENIFDFEEGPCKFLVVLEKSPIPLLDRCPNLPEELAAIIHKSLAKEPADRHGSAREMRDDLQILMRKLRPTQG